MTTSVPLRLAHRGDARRAPENTIDALRAALAIAGCDGVELDVRLDADGEPVLLHDETLLRVQGQPGRADQLTRAELEALGVPSLAAVLEALPHRAFLDVELKVPGGRRVVEVLAGGRGPELRNAVVSSFDRAAVAQVRALAPAWPCWLNAEDAGAATIARAVELGCRGISVDWRALDPPPVARAARAGLEVAAWTVRRRPLHLPAAGADGRGCRVRGRPGPRRIVRLALPAQELGLDQPSQIRIYRFS